MIVRLGELLRAVLRSDVQQEIPLARELALSGGSTWRSSACASGRAWQFDVDLPPRTSTQPD